ICRSAARTPGRTCTSNCLHSFNDRAVYHLLLLALAHRPDAWTLLTVGISGYLLLCSPNSVHPRPPLPQLSRSIHWIKEGRRGCQPSSALARLALTRLF